ncbi:septation protein SepH [Streptomyces iconiensis]|uniref:Septation protein SepH n=1 Tax=Streptomyces iconiensis TaxID=1384038 RepID=A0ABT6ZP67_9ACTN|nr:septation protein SepH [Streptomyces iconiensis]MDJ1130849.1 septation protein SepH [Streptomyces iconiensis]
MPELRVVAVSNDGTRLVLKAADSTEYTLPIDERLRAAVRNDRARLGQIEIEVESHLRPRDIQARIRSGASAEEVASLAGIPVDRVRRFEGPVLAERAFMAERARKTPVRRPGENAGPQLGEAVSERLLLRGADKDSTHWDSWRRDDGTWEVLLAYRVAAQPHSATWTYDPPRRLVQAVDDEARALIGETDDTPEPSFPFVPRIARLPRDRSERAERGESRGEREGRGERSGRPELEPAAFSPAPGDEDDRDRGAGDGSEPDSLTSLLEAVPSFRGDMVVPEPQVPSVPSVPSAPEQPDTSGTPSEQEEQEPESAEQEEEEAVEPPAPAASAGSAYADVLMPRSVGAHRDRLKGTTDRQAEADGVRPGRRAAVPSWDEIVFGTRRKKD